MSGLTDMEALANAGIRTMALFEKVKCLDQFPQNTTFTRREQWPATKLTAEADRFQLWAVNLGLLASGHASLDYRVRDAEIIRLVMLRFIASLHDALTEVVEYFNDASSTLEGAADTNSELDDGGDFRLEDGSDMDLLLDGVRDPIDRLFKLAVWIRNPSSRAASQKVLHHQLVDPETGVDLVDTFRRYDYDYVSALFLEYRKSRAMADRPTVEPHFNHGKGYLSSDGVWEPILSVLSQYEKERRAGTESFLVQRIATACTRRRQQFAYWKHHRSKLGLQLIAAMHQARIRGNSPILHPLQTEIPTTVMPATVGILPTGNTLNPLPAVAQSVTTASRLDAFQATSWNDQATNASVSEYAASEWRPGKEHLGFPSPPNHLSDGKFFECPYCFTICSRALLSERAWRAHLIHDLRPYMCTYEDCKTADQLYDNIQAWIKHEESMHRRAMRCPEHPTHATFTHPGDFRMHLESEHSHCDDDAKEALLIYASNSTSESVARCCPICFVVFAAADDFNNHIARHLERFSLFSLPRSAGDDGADDRHQPGSNEPDNSQGTASRGEGAASRGEGAASRGEGTADTLTFTDVGEGDSLHREQSDGHEYASHATSPPYTLLDDQNRIFHEVKNHNAPTNETTQGRDQREIEIPGPSISVSRYGDNSPGFKNVETLPITHVQAGFAKIGQAEVCCRLMHTKTQWGFLGEPKRPAAIFYMDIDVRETSGTMLQSLTIEIILGEERDKNSREKSAAFTGHYGPAYFHGKLLIQPPRAGGMGPGEEAKASHPSQGFRLTGNIQPHLGSGRRWYNNLQWELKRSTVVDEHEMKPHNRTYHVAFTVEHNSSLFYLRTIISGKIARKGTMRLMDLLPSGLLPDTKRNETVVKFQFSNGYPFTNSLDPIAQYVATQMAYENLDEIPVEIPSGLPTDSLEPS
ncbi:hypothetical protein QBC44DRAFT_386391 [Cladorrhinum sp. PSN332]|nr:hypothetical protein QBC44DRAFT_386391 [Cladorrhinum sp. PSN332]